MPISKSKEEFHKLLKNAKLDLYNYNLNLMKILKAVITTTSIKEKIKDHGGTIDDN